MTHFVIARFLHETNTFAATPTLPEDFEACWGNDARASMRGSDVSMAPMLELADRLGATAATPVAASAACSLAALISKLPRSHVKLVTRIA
jgi:microcystin degradation protein MlrC